MESEGTCHGARPSPTRTTDMQELKSAWVGDLDPRILSRGETDSHEQFLGTGFVLSLAPLAK